MLNKKIACGLKLGRGYTMQLLQIILYAETLVVLMDDEHLKKMGTVWN